MPKNTTVAEEDELESAVGEFEDEPEDDEDESEDEDDSDEPTPAGADSLATHEAKLRKRMSERITAYQKGQRARLVAYIQRAEARLTLRLDEFALRQGPGNVSNPEALKASYARQIAAAAKRFEELNAKLASLTGEAAPAEGDTEAAA